MSPIEEVGGGLGKYRCKDMKTDGWSLLGYWENEASYFGWTEGGALENMLSVKAWNGNRSQHHLLQLQR